MTVYLINGPAAAGTSTVARLLASRFERSVHLDGRVFPHYRLAAAAADAHAGEGFMVALEDGVPGTVLGDYRTAIRTRPCHIVVLHASAPERDVPRVGIWLDTTEVGPEATVDEILARTAAEPAPLVVADYDAGWPALFQRIAQPVRAALDDLGAEVEHIGSTAVPGLAAKPIVDIDVVVRSAGDVPDAIERLVALGYVYQGDKGIRGREAFLWPPGATPHHLYVVVEGSPPHRDHVLFRDYLREHPETAAEYAALKRTLAEQHRDDRLAYTDAKTGFVAGVLARRKP